MVIATPFKKSRRRMERPIPRAVSEYFPAIAAESITGEWQTQGTRLNGAEGAANTELEAGR